MCLIYSSISRYTSYMLVRATSFLADHTTRKIGNIYGGALRKARCGSSCLLSSQSLLADYLINVQQNALESILNIDGLQRRGLDERQAFLLSQGSCVLGRDSPKVFEIGLVACHHYDDVRVGVVPQLAQPPLDVVKGLPLGNVVDQECPHGSSVVSAGYRSVPLLTRCVPYLCLRRLPFYLLGSIFIHSRIK